MKTFADAEQVLAARIPRFEARPQQRMMAAAIEESIASGRTLQVKAGCGTGKSFGYLIPSILSGERVVIATATKALQDQLVASDLPMLQEHLGVDFKWALLKGRSNYYCQRRAQSSVADGLSSSLVSQMTAESETEGFGGERSDFSMTLRDSEWMKVCAEADACAENRCKDQKMGCFAEQARRIAKEADVVVVNHALYCTNLNLSVMSGGVADLIGLHGLVILDEAHEFENICSDALGVQFSEASIAGHLAEVRNFVHRNLEGWDVKNIDELGSEVAAATQILWEVLATNIDPKDRTHRISQANLENDIDAWYGLAKALADYSGAVKDLDVDRVADPTAHKRKMTLSRKSSSVANRFLAIIAAPQTEIVRWIERDITARKVERLVIKSQPISVAAFLAEHLWDTTPAVLTSATLPFDHIAKRLGLKDPTNVDVGTPFDFATQARIYLPGKNFPSPDAKSRTAWEAVVPQRILELVRASDGRALVLFTSIAQMNAVYNVVAPQIDYTCLRQGEGTNKDLAVAFKSDIHSVLFATRSFMTGVDFQGSTCSLVIVDKLPFAAPNDPIIKARCDAIDANGGKSFSEYTIPTMALILEQAAGRLIRHRLDTGVFALLDNRVETKFYGRSILASLPAAPIVHEVAEVAHFFEAQEVSA